MIAERSNATSRAGFDGLRVPVCLFDVEEIGVDPALFAASRHAFYELPWDYYDVRRQQVDALTDALGTAAVAAHDAVLHSYYVGEIGVPALAHLLDRCTAEQRRRFDGATPFRRRSASRFLLTDAGASAWRLRRKPVEAFSQTDAKIDDDGRTDYRKYARVFTETREDVAQSAVLTAVLKGVATLVRSRVDQPVQLDVTCHHTYVEARTGRDGDNSPEGIHQDGYDYIVSALVVEREGITGGVSQIFSDAGRSKLFTTTLKPGQGILQPDKGTPLWHNVTPFSVVDGRQRGHRSSIGLDITIL